MRLWQALEAIPGPAAVLAEWHRLAGAELDFLTPYLQPRQRLAASYPRVVGGEPSYPYEVVEHGPNDFVGICPETEDRIVLTRNDLIVYELDWPLFLTDIAAAPTQLLGQGAHLIDVAETSAQFPSEENEW